MTLPNPACQCGSVGNVSGTIQDYLTWPQLSDAVRAQLMAINSVTQSKSHGNDCDLVTHPMWRWGFYTELVLRRWLGDRFLKKIVPEQKANNSGVCPENQENEGSSIRSWHPNLSGGCCCLGIHPWEICSGRTRKCSRQNNSRYTGPHVKCRLVGTGLMQRSQCSTLLLCSTNHRAVWSDRRLWHFILFSSVRYWLCEAWGSIFPLQATRAPHTGIPKNEERLQNSPRWPTTKRN